MTLISPPAFCQDTVAAISCQEGPFTCAALRKALQENHSVLDGLSTDQARGATYYRIQRLLRAGWLEVQPDRKRPLHYRMTSQFKVSVSALVGREVSQNEKPQEQIKQELQEQLNVYKAEMLSLKGEADEYERLYSLYPSQKGSLMITFQEAMEARSKLAGKMRAVEKQIRYCRT